MLVMELTFVSRYLSTLVAGYPCHRSNLISTALVCMGLDVYIYIYIEKRCVQ